MNNIPRHLRSLMVLGQLRIKDFLERTSGQVRGTLVSDAKQRWYAADYQWETDASQQIDATYQNFPI